MIGKGYWATGITVRYGYAGSGQYGWAASLDFYDSGFVNDDPDHGEISTQGTLATRYMVADGETVVGLTAAIDAVRTDAEKLGITFTAPGLPCLYVSGDGEDETVTLPDGWRPMLAEQAARIGWESPYGTTTVTS